MVLSHLQNKICEALTDAIRAARLETYGSSVSVLELTDPENTPKNTLIKAILKNNNSAVSSDKASEYNSILDFLLGIDSDRYLVEIRK